MCTVKVIDYVVNADLNTKVFNLGLIIAKEGLFWITSGKQYHSLGAHVERIALHKSLV